MAADEVRPLSRLGGPVYRVFDPTIQTPGSTRLRDSDDRETAFHRPRIAHLGEQVTSRRYHRGFTSLPAPTCTAPRGQPFLTAPTKGQRSNTTSHEGRDPLILGNGIHRERPCRSLPSVADHRSRATTSPARACGSWHRLSPTRACRRSIGFCVGSAGKDPVGTTLLSGSPPVRGESHAGSWALPSVRCLNHSCAGRGHRRAEVSAANNRPTEICILSLRLL